MEDTAPAAFETGSRITIFNDTNNAVDRISVSGETMAYRHRLFNHSDVL